MGKVSYTNVHMEAVEELSAARENQGVQLHDAKVDLKNEIGYL